MSTDSKKTPAAKSSGKAVSNAAAKSVSTKAAPKKAATKEAAPEESGSPGAANTSGTATAVARAPSAPAGGLDQDARIALLDKSIQAALAAAKAVSPMLGSGDPDEAADADALSRHAKNKASDLASNRAFLKNATTFKLIADAEVQELDRLARAIDAQILAGAVVNATIEIATEVVKHASDIGQIVDQRG